MTDWMTDWLNVSAHAKKTHAWNEGNIPFVGITTFLDSIDFISFSLSQINIFALNYGIFFHVYRLSVMPLQMHPSSWRGKGSDRFPPFIILSAGKRLRLSTVPTPKLLRPLSRRTCHNCFCEIKRKRNQCSSSQRELKLTPLYDLLKRYLWRELCRRIIFCLVPKLNLRRRQCNIIGRQKKCMLRKKAEAVMSLNWWYDMVRSCCVLAAASWRNGKKLLLQQRVLTFYFF